MAYQTTIVELGKIPARHLSIALDLSLTTGCFLSCQNGPCFGATKNPTSSPTPPQPSSSPTPPIPTTSPVSRPPTSPVAQAVEDVLFASEGAITSQILLYQTPSFQWVQSSVYNFIDMVEGLRVMSTDGVANKVCVQV